MSVIQMPQADDFSRRVGAEIKALMARAGIPQARLEPLLGVNQSAVSKRLRGVTPLDANELAKIADFFHISVSELIMEAEKPRPAGPDGDDERTRRDSNSQPSDWESAEIAEVADLDAWRAKKAA